MMNELAGRAVYGPHMMDTYSTWGFGGLGVVGVIGFLILAAGLVTLLVWAFTRRSAGQPAGHTQMTTTPAEDSALSIARDRLARGEIDAEQYTTIAEALRR